MTTDSPGLRLAADYFRDVVEPLLLGLSPRLPYSAALLGDGSEVLGYDDDISTDHDWGPRLQLFLEPADFGREAERLIPALEADLPEHYRGWPTRFPDPDRPATIELEAERAGSPSHGVEIHSLRAWTKRQLGVDVSERMPTQEEWLAFDEQRLLGLIKGAVFRDDGGDLGALRTRLARYPLAVRLGRIATLWDEIGEEAAFVGRAGDAGDDIGSRLIAARMAERLMRICFLLDGEYAPNSKWFGTAWARLPSAASTGGHIAAILAADDWKDRELAIGKSALAVAGRHVAAGMPGHLVPEVRPYFSRPFRVVNAGEIAEAVRAAVRDAEADGPCG